jgi:hypothetical protein
MATSHVRRGAPAFAVALMIVAGAFFTGPAGAASSWTPYPGSFRPPTPPRTAAAGAHASPTACVRGLCEYTASMIATGSTFAGLTAVLNQPRPNVVPNERSATAIAVESADGRQAITFGWLVSKKLFHDSAPHVVINSVVNGSLHCINGCGFVPLVKKEPKVAVGRTGKYTIKLANARWTIFYNNKAIGYYPMSQWPGHKLTRAHVGIAFGEVVSPSKNHPKSDMGNGRIGTDPRAAKVVGLTLLRGTGSPTFSYLAVDAPGKYDIGFINAACHNGCSMHYGGPGF